MRKFHATKWTIGLALLTAFLLLPTSYAAGTLIGYWKLDENISDATGNNTPTYVPETGGLATYVDGVHGKALDVLDGAGYVGTDLTLAPGQKTMVLYARVPNYSGNKLWAGNSSSGDTRFYLGANNTNVFVGAGDTHKTNTAWPLPRTTGFHHYALVDVGSPKQVKVYKDGALVQTMGYGDETAGTSQFTIGDSRGIPAWAALDDVALFDTALGARDIDYIADHGVSHYLDRVKWHDKNWAYRQEVTVSSGVTSSDLTDFPLLVKITNGSNELFGNAQGDGHDILFTDATGNKLDHEIEFYSDGATKGLCAWVKADVSSAADTKLFMYYGNGGASDQQSVEATWNDNFKMVQHLNETSGTHFDATSNNNDCTSIPSGVTQNATGKIDGADYFDGTASSGFQTPYGQGIDPSTTSQTYELWVKTDTTSSEKIVFSSGQAGDNRMYIGMNNNPAEWEMGIQGDGWGEGITDVKEEWTHLALVLDADTDVATLYVNGVENHQKTYTSFTLYRDLYIGRHSSSTLYFFEGMIDEVRISDTARTADWLMASYLTQWYDPGEPYVTFGPQVVVPEPGTLALLMLGSLFLLFRRRRSY